MPVYLPLLATLDDWFTTSANTARGDVLCRAGCSACCNGPFDISPADAELVAAAVTALPQVQYDAVLQRAQQQRARYVEVLSTWPHDDCVDAVSEEEFDQVSEALAAVPCPALDANGACLIYESRPATCRMTGLAMRTQSDEILDNNCPIIETSPAYAALPAFPFDLESFEEAADQLDRDAESRGWHRTTISGAIARTAG